MNMTPFLDNKARLRYTGSFMIISNKKYLMPELLKE